MVLHCQRDKQTCTTLEMIPNINWSTAEEMIKYEGMYIFGGLLRDGTVSDQLFILQIEPNSTDKSNLYSTLGTWKSQSELKITGKGPSARYDHGL